MDFAVRVDGDAGGWFPTHVPCVSALHFAGPCGQATGGRVGIRVPLPPVLFPHCPHGNPACRAGSGFNLPPGWTGFPPCRMMRRMQLRWIRSAALLLGWLVVSACLAPAAHAAPKVTHAVTFTSSNPKVARIEDGLAVAVGSGTTTLLGVVFGARKLHLQP